MMPHKVQLLTRHQRIDTLMDHYNKLNIGDVEEEFMEAMEGGFGTASDARSDAKKPTLETGFSDAVTA